MLKSFKKRYYTYKRATVNQSHPEDHGRRILIVQTAGLGDAALLAPHVHSLQLMDYNISIACPEGLSEFWEHLFRNINIIPLNTKLGMGRELEQFCLNNFVHEYFAVFAMSINPLGPYICSFPNAEHKICMSRAGRSQRGSNLYCTSVYVAAKDEHINQRYQNLIKIALPGYVARKMEFGNSMQNLDSKYILLHPGAKWAPRRWPVKRYAELANIAMTECLPNVKALIGPGEEELAEEITQQCPECEIVRAKDLGELVDCIANCALFVGNDSGPAHIAAMTGRPTIVLWGPGNLDRVRPLGDNVRIVTKNLECSPCRQYKHGDKCKRGENYCMNYIGIDEVVYACSEFTDKF